MNKEIIEKVLLEISTPTGLTYSGDTTICNDEVKDIMNYINNLEQQCQKQKEVIDKITSNIKNDIDGFMTINDHGECNDILDLLNIYLDILNEVTNNE